MGKVKQIEVKNRTYYFYNDMLNLKNFESNFLKVDKNITKALIHCIGYIGYWIHLYWIHYNYCKNIHSINPLYLLVNHASGYIEEKKWK